jgi:hypothetical protein
LQLRLDTLSNDLPERIAPFDCIVQCALHLHTSATDQDLERGRVQDLLVVRRSQVSACEPFAPRQRAPHHSAHRARAEIVLEEDIVRAGAKRRFDVILARRDDEHGT